MTEKTGDKTNLTQESANNNHRPHLGLALSGGGARGLAHIGVIRALENAGIRPHYLAGTSMGGIIAAFYAAGMKADELQQIAQVSSQTRNILRLLDFAFHQKGFFRGNRVRAFFEHYLQDKTFADLQIPLTLIAVDLNSGREVHFNDGLVVNALRATVSLPGLMVPFEMDGMRLVDGGLLNTLPVDVVQKMGADIVLAVNVNGNRNNSWHEIARFPPVASLFGGPLTVLGDSLDVLIRQQYVYKSLNTDNILLVQPKLPDDVNTLKGYQRVPEIVACGEEAARTLLPALQEALRSSNRPVYTWVEHAKSH